jgi:hypothetical protein
LNSEPTRQQIFLSAARPRDRLRGIQIAKDQHAIGATFAAAVMVETIAYHS